MLAQAALEPWSGALDHRLHLKATQIGKAADSVFEALSLQHFMAFEEVWKVHSAKHVEHQAV